MAATISEQKLHYERLIREIDAKRDAPSPVDALSPGGEWYIVTTNPNCEERATWSLQGAGIHCFNPTMRRWTVHARKRRVVERSLFPRYLFVFLRSDQSFYRLRKCYGVEGILCSDGEPYAIREGRGVKGRAFEALSALIEQVTNGDFDETREKPLPAPGTRMVVKAGAYGQLPVIVHEAKSEKRIEVMLTIMGVNKLVPVALDRLDYAE